jgi:hypothetical protein
MRLLKFALWFIALLGAGVAQAQIGLSNRSATNQVVEDVDLSVHAGYRDVSLQFTCSLRYLSHLPSSEGDTLRLRLMPQPGCALSNEGLVPPLLSGVVRNLIAAIDVDQVAINEVQLLIRWRKKEHFLVMPNATDTGLRIRVLGTTETTGRVLIDSSVNEHASYALNLLSSLTPIDASVVQTAAAAIGTRVYVSETDVNGEHWFRLRAGPFVAEKDAQRSLLAVRDRYPQAWLAINDDEILNSASKEPITAPLQVVARSGVGLAVSERDEIFKQAKAAFRKKDYATALPLLTKLTEQAEYPERAEVQELLGLAHERSRHVAHAKAEYEEYLRRYPNGAAADRIRQRLRALQLAARKSVKGLRVEGDDDSVWKFYGGVGQFYRYDDARIETPTAVGDTVSQSALLNDVSFVARRRGERYDFFGRLGASYIKNFADNALGDQTRVSSAFVELSDRELGWRSRFGRQSAASSGVFGAFDGVYADYQWLPRLRVSLLAGSPVDTSASSFDADRQLLALAVNIGPYASAWDFTTYAVTQKFQSESDRRALGTEVHYFVPGRSMIALVDYDLYFKELNNALFIGTVQLPHRWMLNASYDHRRSPSLSIRNALIGQTAVDLDELLRVYTREEIQQFAIDRSAPTDLFSLSASVAAGERWQWTFDVSRIAIGEMESSGGVQSTPALAPEMAYSVLAIGNGIFAAHDVELITLRYQSGEMFKTTSLSLSSRWPIASSWRVGPRARVDRREGVLDGSTQTIYLPSLRLEFLRQRATFELEVGVELGKRDTVSPTSVVTTTSTEKTTRKFLSAGYRWQF